MEKQSKQEEKQNKQQQAQQNNENKDEYDQVLSGFDQIPLNLTNQEKDDEEDPEMMAKIKNQYDKFMKEMQNGFSQEGPGEGQQDIDMDKLGSAFGDLLKGLTNEMGQGGGESENIGKTFSDMFKNINQDNMQEAASKLLNEFMDKSLLLQPLQQTKANYQQYFDKSTLANISPQLMKNYKKQYQIVVKILQILQKQPNNKTQMIKLFEEMQQYGDPPEGIAPQTGLF